MRNRYEGDGFLTENGQRVYWGHYVFECPSCGAKAYDDNGWHTAVQFCGTCNWSDHDGPVGDGL